MSRARAAASSTAARGPLSLSEVLTSTTRRLLGRLAQLEQQLDATDESAWPAYLATLDTLVRVAAQATPGGRGELLTTSQMAARLGIKPTTLLKHRKTGAITPAVARGKLIRWRGSEAIR